MEELGAQVAIVTGTQGHWPRHCESSCGGQIPSLTKCGRVIANTLGLFGA